jgi:hypothetical protein
VRKYLAASCTVLFCGISSAQTQGNPSKSIGADAPASKGHITVATSYISPAGHPKLAGQDVAGDLGLPSMAFADLGLKIDMARSQSDLVSLGALASELRYLEQVAGKTSKIVNSNELAAEAGEVVKARSPYALHPVDRKSAFFAAPVSGQTAVGKLNPADPGVPDPSDGAVPIHPVQPSLGDPGPPVAVNPDAGPEFPPVNPEPSPSPSHTPPPPPRCNPPCAADVRGTVPNTAEGETTNPGIPSVGAYIQLRNRTTFPLQVVIDGTYYGYLEGGMYNTYAVHPGAHNIRASNSSLGEIKKAQQLGLGDTLYLKIACAAGGCK